MFAIGELNLITISLVILLVLGGFQPRPARNHCLWPSISSDIHRLIPGYILQSMLCSGIAIFFLCYTAIYLQVRKVWKIVKNMNVERNQNGANSIISDGQLSMKGSGTTPSKSSNNDIEHQVLIMCVAMTAAVSVCWVTVFLVTLCEIIMQIEPPEWADSLAYMLGSLDGCLFTPIILILFNNEYRKHWYTHVIPKSLRNNRFITGIYGKAPSDE